MSWYEFNLWLNNYTNTIFATTDPHVTNQAKIDHQQDLLSNTSIVCF